MNKIKLANATLRCKFTKKKEEEKNMLMVTETMQGKQQLKRINQKIIYSFVFFIFTISFSIRLNSVLLTF